jgi:hypothetical protein
LLVTRTTRGECFKAHLLTWQTRWGGTEYYTAHLHTHDHTTLVMLDLFKAKSKVTPLEWRTDVTKWDLDVLTLISVHEDQARKVSVS